MVQLVPPSTESLSKVIGGEAIKKVEVEIDDNRRVDLLIHRDQVDFFLESSEEPVAVLRFGSSYSGALWLSGDVIGEFYKAPNGPFVVVEIQDGFKRPHPMEDVDPIGYLIKRLASLPT